MNEKQNESTTKTITMERGIRLNDVLSKTQRVSGVKRVRIHDGVRETSETPAGPCQTVEFAIDDYFTFSNGVISSTNALISKLGN